MRLIHTKTLQCKEFFGEYTNPYLNVPDLEGLGQDIPTYAILSHTWGEEEVSLSEWNLLLENPEADKSRQIRNKTGYSKIKKFCELCQQGCAICLHFDCSAKKNSWCRKGLEKAECMLNLAGHCTCKPTPIEWTWVDTCCIDKTSSSELSESINSMYEWYRKSAICYAYLSDVPEGDDIAANGSAFRKSIWFTRGWTLQELIAPRTVQFFNKQWNHVGSKLRQYSIVAQITSIPEQILSTKGDPHYELGKFSVAQKMSWASTRQTTRKEDIAYCVLGLFDINMPLLYGEGNKAFFRLQQEIMKHSTDQTLLGWCAGDTMPDCYYPGILATHPSCFRNAKCLREAAYSVGSQRGQLELFGLTYTNPQELASLIKKMASKPFQLTNQGLEIFLQFIPNAQMKSRHDDCDALICEYAILNCWNTKYPNKIAAIQIQRGVQGYPQDDPGVSVHRINGYKLDFLDCKEVYEALIALHTELASGQSLQHIYMHPVYNSL